MRLFRSVAIVSFFCLLIAGCSRSRVVEIRIVSTTDVHGRIFDKDILDGTERKGSLAKVSTLLRNERRNNRHLIYLDAGDILQGSIEVYQDATAQYYRSSLPAEAYKYLDCRAMALGNHELSSGVQSYERFIRTADFPVMGANICFDRYGDYLWPYCIFEEGGVKIAVLALTTPIVSFSIPKDRMGELTAKDPQEAARHYVADVREKADVLIGLFHSGYQGGRNYDGVCENIVKEFIDMFPEFDLILFGHDHVPFCKKEARAGGDSILLMNAGPFAEHAAVATLRVDYSQGEKPKVSACGELVDVTPLAPDVRFMSAVSGWYDDVNRYADSIIGTLSVPLECNAALWRPVSTIDYIHETQLGFFGAQVSLAAPVSTVPYIPAGDFRIRDAFSLYKFDNNMVSVMLKGCEIKNVLEYSADLYYCDAGAGLGHILKLKTDPESGKKMPENDASGFISAAGINYTIDVTKPYGKRVEITSMSDGHPFEEDRMYRTTINSFLYSGAESVLLKGSGVSRGEIQSRLNCSSEADIRYYMLTDFWLKREAGKGVNPKKVSNWRLIPEDVVSAYLASDTINFTII